MEGGVNPMVELLKSIGYVATAILALLLVLLQVLHYCYLLLVF